MYYYKSLKAIAASIIFTMIFLPASSQITNPDFDPAEHPKPLQPSNIFLDAEKNLCELKEKINVSVRILLTDDEGVPEYYGYNFKNAKDAPWKQPVFTIVSGNATVGITEGNAAQIIMPDKMPKEKAVVIQAILNPAKNGFAKVQVFTTIYLEDNQNVFYFNCPYLGINNEKYVVNNNGGIDFSLPQMPHGDYKNMNQAIDAKQKAALEKIRIKQAQEKAIQKGLDLAALTSNAKAIYSKDEDVTSIIINGNVVEMENGLRSNAKRNYMIALSFPGRKSGTFEVKKSRKITATITFPNIWHGVACACTDNPEDDAQDRIKPSCAGGNIIITKYDGKIVEGKLNVRLESQDYNQNPPVTFFSTINGTFAVPVSN